MGPTCHITIFFLSFPPSRRLLPACVEVLARSNSFLLLRRGAHWSRPPPRRAIALAPATAPPSRATPSPAPGRISRSPWLCREEEPKKWQLLWAPLYWGRSNSPFIWGKKRSLLLTTKKKGGSYWGAAGATNQPHLPQYGSFMWMRDEIGELLEMLLHL